MRLLTLASLTSVLFVVLTSCGPAQPPSRATAERLCAEEAALADGIAGNVGVAGGTSGAGARGSVTITSDILNPRSEADALRDCVARRMAGQPNPRGGGLTLGLSVGGST
ncbi:hypothetical protein [Gymnodinialimonas ceratoperidinii]|uniref:Uncharacterized protein n=1 Tax=Gymnodinialimonas ceratoperidinii TaxID=2856823 RepID=A0A8F6TYS6_9RHOB|nr:hypothetical protein [Gymnodinialimonas ceratoperidinii]QXT40454.1 hypothetical protein KYE46_04180 [Gymnodinialimonas ceratoperidinii]